MRATVETLLSGLCDATVTLNATFEISTPCAKLDTLLLSSRPWQDRSFLDTMHILDVHRFQTHIDQAGCQSHASSLNVCLQTSSGATVPVKLFHAPFLDFWTDELKHFIGITEHSNPDEVNMPAPLESASMPDLSGINFGESCSQGSSESNLTLRFKDVTLRTNHRTVPMFEVTPQGTIDQMIARVLKRMNVHGRGCCTWHVGLTALSSHCKRMACSRGCFSEFKVFMDWQCETCKALNVFEDDDDSSQECGICGEEHSREASADASQISDHVGISA